MRSPFSLVALGLLGLLAAGGAALGIVQAPTGADLSVHNDAAATLAATPVSGQVRGSSLGTVVLHFVLTDSDHLVETASGPSLSPERRVVKGSAAIGVLQPVQGVLTQDGFHSSGSTFTRTAPASTLVPASQQSTISGTYKTTVDTADGFVTKVTETVAATDAGRAVHERLVFRITRVGTRHLP